MRLLFIRHGDPDYEHDTLTEKGRREAALLASLPDEVDALAKEHDAHIDWDRPLAEAKLA